MQLIQNQIRHFTVQMLLIRSKNVHGVWGYDIKLFSMFHAMYFFDKILKHSSDILSALWSCQSSCNSREQWRCKENVERKTRQEVLNSHLTKSSKEHMSRFHRMVYSRGLNLSLDVPLFPLWANIMHCSSFKPFFLTKNSNQSPIC